MDTSDLQPFDAASAAAYLKSFDARVRREGEGHFHGGHVSNLICEIPGKSFAATFGGMEGERACVSFEDDLGEWIGVCTCDLIDECQHCYALMRAVLSDHSANRVQQLSSGSELKPVVPSADKGLKNNPPQSLSIPFPKQIQVALGRKLKPAEDAYISRILRLWNQVSWTETLVGNDLAFFGSTRPTDGWARVRLWSERPDTVGLFWNYIAFYIRDNGGVIPDFMLPVTDLEGVAERVRQAKLTERIARWQQTFGGWTRAVAAESSTLSADVRIAFGDLGIEIETQIGDGGWKRLKTSRINDFSGRYQEKLSTDALMIWLPFSERSRHSYVSGLNYTDAWAQGVISRLLRQPGVRSRLVDSEGDPLVFNEDSLRWDLRAPDELETEYRLQLIDPLNRRIQSVIAVFAGDPTLFLTNKGVYPGPTADQQLLATASQESIPADALETTQGIQFLSALRVPLPEKLSSKISVVRMIPLIRAEIRKAYANSETEYCYLDLLAVSPMRTRVETWNGAQWLVQKVGQRTAGQLEQVDYSTVDPIRGRVAESGFSMDFTTARWSQRITSRFPESFIPFLKSLPPEAILELKGELASLLQAETSGRLQLEVSESEIDWFDLKVVVNVDDTSLTPEEIKLLLDAKGKWVRLGKKGWKRLQFQLSEEENRDLARLGLTAHGLSSEPQRLHALQLADKAARKFLKAETCERIERRAQELQTRVTPDIPLTINATLRQYQTEGYHFLCYLTANRFGGILADDMGLGKTLQTLTWLARLHEEARAKNEVLLPSLVVCPKSVTDNWRSEAARFLATLKVRVWSPGDVGSLSSLAHECDLNVINYSQLRGVGDSLAKTDFLAVILDEGQYIKNPSSITAQIARRLRARNRLILSGTPIENRLLDLWSLMSFAMPGVLGSRSEFLRLFDGKNDPFARQRLSARVRPFLLRRTKVQVAKDLPDRIEEDMFCELEGKQKALYQAELKVAQQVLLKLKTASAFNKERFNLLTSLLRLRQICCDGRLISPELKEEGAKIQALRETLEPLMEEGHKVLVFSQFIDALELMKGVLKEHDWPMWYLAGNTENRGELVESFQNHKGPGVFLISLKAGGFGLNLTAASYVIIFDPWWNPAVENQAIDRTHRIGQVQKVIAYRLLIKDSIEEKIRALQTKKKALAEDVLGEEKFSQSLTMDDLHYLLSD